ncbi:MAG: zinc-binding dehydrogenase [Anaerolineales bacterium]|nr:zinc-binding dehydrogenase [Anaerolineales bacterium]MCB0007403.1 zinc-binding dehydrogenase [Anaerolineales bacterium]MCB0013323.1 zinc-binding dehydrogenase [Anaerolineales bacterium]MCB0019416.1 zinc-binding dehydrogenase [Anaerolineales bacterium]
MKQVWITKAGPPEVLSVRNSPDPPLRGGEVRIRVQASGVNFADILGRMGIYPDAPGIPYVPGYEIAGIVEELGQGATNLHEGDPVIALTRFGGYSELVNVPHKHVFKRLEWMNAEHGAALPIAYLTAYIMLIVMGSLRPEDKVLIHSAAGGVGLAAIDICRIVGAETIGTASTAKHEFITQRGLDHPVDYRRVDYEAAVMDITGGKGVSMVLDPLGGNNWRKNYRLLRPTGRLICYGASSIATGKTRRLLSLLDFLRHRPTYNPIQLMRDNRGVVGVNLAHLWDYGDMIRPWMQQIIDWYDEAQFRPHVDKTFSFAKAAEAHHYIQDRKNIGKVLLIP